MLITEPFEEIVARIEGEAQEGFFHTGAQIVVSQEGERVLDVAVGHTHLHEPYRTETLSSLYCAAKPTVTVAVLALIAQDELSIDDKLGDVVEDLPARWIAERTIEQVLAHTAGLHVVNTILARILPERSREGWVYASEPPAGWKFGVDRAYSEFGGWFMLGKVIEALTEEPFDLWVRDNVLAPYGVPADDLILRIHPEDYERFYPRISATLDLTMEQAVPLLAEVGPETTAEWNPSFGAYGTMEAVATFYEGLLGDLDGANVVLPAELLQQAVAPRLPVKFDPTLNRDAGFGLGFMTPLSSHEFGKSPSDQAFGHAGQGGTSFAMADPASDLVLAVLFNAGLDADTALSFRRVNLVSSIYKSLGL
ncbi:MAG: beta-lactamase family protein [Microthrixaceae bacterium]|nr:beta-lactamase family protein [Microthrixaceae bacterium]